MTNDDTITACPECDSSRIRRRVTDRKEYPWKCKDCCYTFNDPVERERHTHGVGADVMLERVIDNPEELKEATEL